MISLKVNRNSIGRVISDSMTYVLGTSNLGGGTGWYGPLGT